MQSDKTSVNCEREHTDASLRVERDKADQALGEQFSALDLAADAVISRVRARADAVIASTRAHSDKRSGSAPAESHNRVNVERELEDQSKLAEEGDADDDLRAVRTRNRGPFGAERLETDKGLRRERREADAALANRDQVLGIVSHDLRNLLLALLGHAELLSEEYAQLTGDSRGREHIHCIERAGLRMGRMIGDLVDVGSISAGRLVLIPEAGKPSDVVTEAVGTSPCVRKRCRAKPVHAGVHSYSGVRESKLIRWHEHTPPVFEMR